MSGVAAEKVARATTLTGDYLSCRVGVNSLALALASVREVIVLGRVTRLPNTPPWHLGLVNHRGIILSVVDTHLLFGYPSPGTRAETQALVLASDHSSRGQSRHMEIAFTVDEVGQIVHMAGRPLIAAPTSGALGDVLTGVVLPGRGERELIVVDVERLLWSPALHPFGALDDEA